MKRLFLVIVLGSFLPFQAFADPCYIVLYQIQGAPYASMAGAGGGTSLTLLATGNLTSGTYQNYPVGTMIQPIYAVSFRLDATAWTAVVARNYHLPVATLLDGVPEEKRIEDPTGNFPVTVQSQPLSCPAANPCEQLANTPGDTTLVGMPYHAQYYETVGVCSEGCVQKPSGSVIMEKFASDGSGYIIGPWSYTGDQCTAGVTAAIPAQPSQEEVCGELRNACEAKCAGAAYTFDCTTGGCECTGPPSYATDPAKDPTVPTTDPGAPALPADQTAVANPGGDAQLGAQIDNQGKQISQGNAQLGQLGAINNKLASVIANQGKQLGQGDDIIDYQRRQLGALEDIRNQMKEDGRVENPGVPGNLELDTGVGDAKEWGEHDDWQQVAQDRANRDLQNLPGSTPLPLDFDLTASGSPVLSGVMYGRTIEIRFDRPWMQTGYSIMAALLVGIGYLQVFLMINRTLIER